MITRLVVKLLSNKSYIFGIVSFILILSIYSIAHAVWVTIDTDDGVVDADWAVNPSWDPVYTGSCTNSDIADIDEIQYAWIGNDATHFYFRIQACAGPAISEGTRSVAAGFDCSIPANNSWEDFEDAIAVWGENPSQNIDYVELYSGNHESLAPVGTQENYMEYGERVGTGGTSIEWRVPIEVIEQDHGEWQG